MPIVDQSADLAVRQAPAHAIPSTPFEPSEPVEPVERIEHYALSVEEEAQILYEATIRGLADVAAGRKLPSEVVKTGCSVDLNEAYFEFPHDPSEIHVDEFVGILLGLRDADAGRTVPDEVVSAEAEAWRRSVLKRL
ncbi:hypothetical protein OYT13_01230 [Pandoraea sp. XJJ-1]|uniref:Uncharacterized protein n=1 Tax=Pandoraea cepalis TaxID=2508294 RepID=A0A5E4RLG8_9BURK|nr:MULTISPECIES: hypothetical protein [Pandoraea]OJY21306.1 MAG: hypothetical protein BGP02_19890 [Pandoraea sp. 64-18]WAL83141.1 hypothetical protein OYT13_01230 [Pandoraea sp. XJJ-1]VVD63955.1 hypothetical protein PCE31106_00243 [Pandoraea cepalis]